MPQSADYKQGYGKGYYTGRGERSDIEQRHQAEMQAVAARAERAERAAGIGHCEDCRHWKRISEAHAWGICKAEKAPGTPYGCWAQAMEPETPYRMVQISTSPRFGCVLFSARDEALKELGS